MANSDLQMKRPYPPLSFVNEFRPHIELVPANEVPFQLKSIYQNKALLCQKIL
ncbi:phage protein [Yersinia intermedia]|nr:phage protein [Yersinia intermedia]CNF83288.1 phage protein [Yersinia intermedia]